MPYIKRDGNDQDSLVMWTQFIVQIYLTFLILANLVDAVLSSIYQQCQGSKQLYDLQNKLELITNFHTFQTKMNELRKVETKAYSRFIIVHRAEEK